MKTFPTLSQASWYLTTPIARLRTVNPSEKPDNRSSIPSLDKNLVFLIAKRVFAGSEVHRTSK